MTSEEIPPSAAETQERILAEHQQIRDLVHTIEGAEDVAEVASALQQLQPLFKQHFAREEGQEGLHTDIHERAPQHRQAIEDLRKDHQKLLEGVALLQEQVLACEGGLNQEIRKQCTNFFRRLREHEARESELFLDAIWTDLGQGG